MTPKTFLPIILLLIFPIIVLSDKEQNINTLIDLKTRRLQNWLLTWERFVAYYYDPYPLDDVEVSEDRYVFPDYTKLADQIGLSALYEKESTILTNDIENSKIHLQNHFESTPS